PYYRILSGSDFRKCWSVPVEVGNPRQMNSTSGYTGLSPVALVECNESDIAQEFVLLQDYVAATGWVLYSRLLPGKCLANTRGLTAFENCKAGKPSQALRLPGFNP
ncbi:hypothetical protein Vretifemale_12854, partial [Volvox reticuliferus]